MTDIDETTAVSSEDATAGAAVEEADFGAVASDNTDDAAADEKFISQRELDRILQSRVERANKSAEKKYLKQMEEMASKLKEYEDAKLSADEKKDKRLTELEQNLAEATDRYTKLERTRVIESLAREMGLPEKFWSRVQGTTDDEIISDINDMLEGLPRSERSEGVPSQKPRVSVQATNTDPEVEENPKSIVDKIGSMFPF